MDFRKAQDQTNVALDFFFQADQVARSARFNFTKSLSLSLPKPMCNSAAGLVDDQIDLT